MKLGTRFFFLFLFLPVLLLPLLSAYMRSYPLYFSILDSHGRRLENAVLTVNGISAVYDSDNHQYLVTCDAESVITIRVVCDGYETIEKKSPVAPYHSIIYMVAPGDHYYYDGWGWKVSYPPRPDELLVYLKEVDETKNTLTPEKAVELLKPLLIAQGLVISHNYYDGKEELPESYSGQYRQLVVMKKDSSAFAEDSCSELAALRNSLCVAYAGPLVMHQEPYYNAYTYGNRIYAPLVSGNDFKAADQFALTLDAAYDHTKMTFILKPSYGKQSVLLVEKIWQSGLFSSVEMEMCRMTKNAN